MFAYFSDARTASVTYAGMPPGQLRGYDGLERIIAHRWLPGTLEDRKRCREYFW